MERAEPGAKMIEMKMDENNRTPPLPLLLFSSSSACSDSSDLARTLTAYRAEFRDQERELGRNRRDAARLSRSPPSTESSTEGLGGGEGDSIIGWIIITPGKFLQRLGRASYLLVFRPSAERCERGLPIVVDDQLKLRTRRKRMFDLADPYRASQARRTNVQ